MFGMSARPSSFPVGRLRGAAILVNLVCSLLLVVGVISGSCGCRHRFGFLGFCFVRLATNSESSPP